MWLFWLKWFSLTIKISKSKYTMLLIKILKYYTYCAISSCKAHKNKRIHQKVINREYNSAKSMKQNLINWDHSRATLSIDFIRLENRPLLTFLWNQAEQKIVGIRNLAPNKIKLMLLVKQSCINKNKCKKLMIKTSPVLWVSARG